MRTSKTLLGLLALALIAPAWLACAQVAPRVESLDVPAAPLAQPPARLDLQLSPAPIERLVLGAPVQVNAFRFRGAHTVPEAELVRAVTPWTGRRLGTEELAQAADALTGRLREMGLLVAQAYVPRQEIRDGVVEIVVLEGRIGAIRLEVPEGARLSRAAAERFLAALRPGDTLRRDNVEHHLLILNDLPGTRLGAALVTGSEPDTADLRIKLDDDGNPVTGSLTLDNAGLPAAGDYRADLNLRLRSPLGIGDLISVRVRQSSSGGQTLGSLTYGLPVNGLGTRIGVRFVEQRYRISEEFTLLGLHGEQYSASLLASHPLIRRSDHNLTLGLSYSNIEFKDSIDVVAVANETRHRVASVSLASDFRDRLFGNAATALQAQLFSGRVLLLGPGAAAQDAAPGGLNVGGSFAMLRFRAERLQAIDGDSSVFFGIHGQIASKNLDAGPELVLGGPDAVRAYPVGELYADQGFVARIEYRRDIALSSGSRTTLSAFVDQARVHINRNPLRGDPSNKRGLGGYGLGLRHAIGEGVAIQSWFAWRTSEKSATAPERSPRVWVSVVTSF